MMIYLVFFFSGALENIFSLQKITSSNDKTRDLSLGFFFILENIFL